MREWATKGKVMDMQINDNRHLNTTLQSYFCTKQKLTNTFQLKFARGNFVKYNLADEILRVYVGMNHIIRVTNYRTQHKLRVSMKQAKSKTIF